MVRIFLIEKSSNNNDNINFENIYLDKWSLSRDSSGKVTISGEELSDKNNPAVEQLINKITSLPASSDDCKEDKKSELELAAKLIEEGNANITITGECNLHIDSVDTLSNLTATSNSGYAAITIDSTQNIMTLRASSNSEACNVVVQTNEEIGNISGAGGSALNINMDKVDYIDSIAATDSSTINLSAESKVDIKDYTGSIIAVEHAEDQVKEQVEEHTEEPTATLTEDQAEEQVEEHTEEPTATPTEDQAEEQVEEHTEEPTATPTEDQAEGQVEEHTEEPTEKLTEEQAREQAEDNISKAPFDDTIIQSPEVSPFISITSVNNGANNTANNNPENKALDIALDIASDPLLAEVYEVLEAEIKRTLPLVKAENEKNAQASKSNVNITPNVATNANVNNTTPNVVTNTNVNNATPNVVTNAIVNSAPKAEANVNSEAAKITANAASTSVYDIYNDKIRFEDKSIKPPTLDSIKSAFNTFKP